LPEFSCVSVSHYAGGKEVAKHLVSMGYSSFVYVGDEGDEKEKGYKDEIINSGFNVDKCYISVCEEEYDLVKNNNNFKEFILRNSNYEGVGIFAKNDMVALNVLKVLKEINAKIPEKIALVGFDNIFIDKEVTPNLSSVAQPIDEIGRQAVHMLIDKITKNNIEEQHIVLEPRIVVRESSLKLIKY
jgi:LacI family transcriptional regulator